MASNLTAGTALAPSNPFTFQPSSSGQSSQQTKPSSAPIWNVPNPLVFKPPVKSGTSPTPSSTPTPSTPTSTSGGGIHREDFSTPDFGALQMRNDFTAKTGIQTPNPQLPSNKQQVSIDKPLSSSNKPVDVMTGQSIQPKQSNNFLSGTPLQSTGYTAQIQQAAIRQQKENEFSALNNMTQSFESGYFTKEKSRIETQNLKLVESNKATTELAQQQQNLVRQQTNEMNLLKSQVPYTLEPLGFDSGSQSVLTGSQVVFRPETEGQVALASAGISRMTFLGKGIEDIGVSIGKMNISSSADYEKLNTEVGAFNEQSAFNYRQAVLPTLVATQKNQLALDYSGKNGLLPQLGTIYYQGGKTVEPYYEGTIGKGLEIAGTTNYLQYSPILSAVGVKTSKAQFQESLKYGGELGLSFVPGFGAYYASRSRTSQIENTAFGGVLGAGFAVASALPTPAGKIGKFGVPLAKGALIGLGIGGIVGSTVPFAQASIAGDIEGMKYARTETIAGFGSMATGTYAAGSLINIGIQSTYKPIGNYKINLGYTESVIFQGEKGGFKTLTEIKQGTYSVDMKNIFGRVETRTGTFSGKVGSIATPKELKGMDVQIVDNEGVGVRLFKAQPSKGFDVISEIRLSGQKPVKATSFVYQQSETGFGDFTTKTFVTQGSQGRGIVKVSQFPEIPGMKVGDVTAEKQFISFGGETKGGKAGFDIFEARKIYSSDKVAAKPVEVFGKKYGTGKNSGLDSLQKYVSSQNTDKLISGIMSESGGKAGKVNMVQSQLGSQILESGGKLDIRIDYASIGKSTTKMAALTGTRTSTAGLYSGLYGIIGMKPAVYAGTTRKPTTVSIFGTDTTTKTGQGFSGILMPTTVFKTPQKQPRVGVTNTGIINTIIPKQPQINILGVSTIQTPVEITKQQQVEITVQKQTQITQPVPLPIFIPPTTFKGGFGLPSGSSENFTVKSSFGTYDSPVRRFKGRKSKLQVRSSDLRKVLFGEHDIIATKAVSQKYFKELARSGTAISFPTMEEFNRKKSKRPLRTGTAKKRGMKFFGLKL